MFEITNQEEAIRECKPEWIRIPEAVRLFGISRTKLYALIKEGKFTSVSLRERGQTRGTRLINYQSLCEYIQSCVEMTPPERRVEDTQL